MPHKKVIEGNDKELFLTKVALENIRLFSKIAKLPKGRREKKLDETNKKLLALGYIF
ncbi:MAG: hypothetical protein ABIA02_03945 [Candidatus Falkowbacteria bacterium]